MESTLRAPDDTGVVRTSTAVLLVEDDERISEPLVRVLRSEGFEVEHVDGGMSAIDSVAAARPDPAGGDLHGAAAVIEEGDPISIDIEARTVNLDLPEAVIASRLALWTQPEPKVKRGILGLCAKTALQADLGGMLDDRC